MKIKKMHEIERDAILLALKLNNGHRENSAKALGISISTLKDRIKDYRSMGFDIPGEKMQEVVLNPRDVIKLM